MPLDAVKVTFVAQDAAASAPSRLVVQVVEQNKLPAGLAAGLADAAHASRFAGKLGQVFESFSGAGEEMRRSALVGIGEPDSAGRIAAFERYISDPPDGAAHGPLRTGR